MKTSILLVGRGDLVSFIQGILCAEGYQVEKMEWTDLNRISELTLTNLNMIILMNEGCHEDTLKNGLESFVHIGVTSPLLVITPKISPELIVELLDYGANDVMEAPIHGNVMMARIRNLLRVFSHASQEDEEVIVVHDLKVNLRSRRVSRAGEYLVLTPKEYELLEFLARHVNEACPRSVILREVWGYDFAMDTNVVDVYIKHLRVKVDKGRSVKLIHTVRGIGYMLHTQ
ncbi:response regulator transcription factor [Paenibacillus sp. 276b]|uniref:winged helix-turn-helix domain-containing protein n=1 Tax=Paenibacillus sp. 276b TaxID=1566277 RepID=UPI00089D2B86|nr:response regulator transcription factor [Paenibacillus sp. 276b]SEA77358.1 Transcriptional regulatory protein, C terminal [Paenibacillus sp. 276b]